MGSGTPEANRTWPATRLAHFHRSGVERFHHPVVDED